MDIKDFLYLVSGRDPSDKQVPWIIFLHGLLGSVANWRRIIPSFEANYKILAFDQRGHGKSFHPKKGYTPEDFAGDIEFIMLQLKIDRANFVGHSMGARNALCFAHLHPAKVTRLVIEDIGPEASTKNGSELIEILKRVPVPFSDKRLAKEYLLSKLKDSKLGNFLYTNIILDSKGQAVWSFDLDSIVEIIEKGRGSSRWNELEGLKNSCLVIRGEGSEELPLDEYERMKACNPRVQGVEIKNSGHWVHFEQPDKFIEVVSDFLKK